MCGIAGIFSPSVVREDVLKSMALAMADTLYHRGPDSFGVWVDSLSHLALSHRRLSIQDLSPAGHQPMASPSGRFYMVFNGEIYNFQSLAGELRRLGYRFRGRSDTEVILAGIEEWGIEETLHRSSGMFAMAIWDNQEQELTLCRDRMGEKPLFFGWVDNCFAFASELKALKKVFPSSLEVSKSSLAAFFRFGYVPTPYSIYTKIFKLQPGTFLLIPRNPFPTIDGFSPLPEAKIFSPKQYWNLNVVFKRGLSNPFIDENNTLDQFDQLLRETVVQQKIADVPIGAFLSGGIDSSLISAVMQSVSDRPIKTFTIGFHEKEFDEAPYARAIAKHIGSEHHEHYVSAGDGLNLIEDIPRYWDEPFADSSQIPSLLVAQMARRHVSVCLTGDGGDELFCGYNRYFLSSALWARQQRIPFALRCLIGKTLDAIPRGIWQAWYQIYKKLSRNKCTQANVGLKIHKFAGQLCMKSQYMAYRYLMSYWQAPDDILPNTKEVSSVLDRESYLETDEFINAAMYWDQLGYLVDDNLVKGDRSSMAFSLETRLPLLDHRIVEFSWRLPLSMKYRNGTSKWLLRRLLDRYVPTSLIERPKMGFSVPLCDWLKGPLKTWVGDLLHSGCGKSAELNRFEIERIWREHQRGSHDHSHKLWVLCMWLAWENYQR